MAPRTSNGGVAEATTATTTGGSGAAASGSTSHSASTTSSKSALPHSNVTPGVRTSALLLASQLPPPLLELLPRMHSSGFLSDLLEMHANGLLESLRDMREELGGAGLAAAAAAAALSLGLVKGASSGAGGVGTEKLAQGVQTNVHGLRRSRVVSGKQLSEMVSGASLSLGDGNRSVSAAPSASGSKGAGASPEPGSPGADKDDVDSYDTNGTAFASSSSRPLSGRKRKPTSSDDDRAKLQGLFSGRADVAAGEEGEGEVVAGEDGAADGQEPVASSSKRTITIKRSRAPPEEGGRAEDDKEGLDASTSSKRRKSLKGNGNSSDSSRMSNREVHTRVALASGLRPLDSRASTPVPTDEERAWAEEQARREKMLEQGSSSKSRRRRSSARELVDDLDDGYDYEDDDDEDPNARRSARRRKARLVFSPPPGDQEIRRRRGIVPKRVAGKPSAQANGQGSAAAGGRGRASSGRKSISWGDGTPSNRAGASRVDGEDDDQGMGGSAMGSEADELADDDENDETDFGSSDGDASDYYEPKRGAGSSARRASSNARSGHGSSAHARDNGRSRSVSGTSGGGGPRTANSPTSLVSPFAPTHSSTPGIRRAANGRFADRKSNLPAHSPPIALDGAAAADVSQSSVDALPLPRAVPGAQLHWCYICNPPHPYDKRGSLRQHYTRLRRKGIRVENGGPGGGGKKADPHKDRMRGVVVRDEMNGETVVVSPLSQQHRQTSATPGARRKSSAPLTPGSVSYDASYASPDISRVGGSSMYHDEDEGDHGLADADHDMEPPEPLSPLGRDSERGGTMHADSSMAYDEAQHDGDASLGGGAGAGASGSSANLYDASTNLFASSKEAAAPPVPDGIASTTPAVATTGRLKVMLKRPGNGGGGAAGGSSSGAATPLHHDGQAAQAAATAAEDA